MTLVKINNCKGFIVSLANMCLKLKDGVSNFDDKKYANIFKKIFFCTLARDLLANLPPPFFRFGLHSVWQYYEKILKYPNSKFKFNFFSEKTLLKLLKGTLMQI